MRLQAEELIALIRRVFGVTAADRRLAVLVDLPDARVPDNPDWRERRAMAADWVARLRERRDALGMDADLVLYRTWG